MRARIENLQLDANKLELKHGRKQWYERITIGTILFSGSEKGESILASRTKPVWDILLHKEFSTLLDESGEETKTAVP
jgi:hypothetical protein